ncbi:MAG: hypothetical protein HY696_08970 [Deltaproteobacteria bacterium]|nr:hypothetical protein [Deltaproteobacteria bacterium]
MGAGTIGRGGISVNGFGARRVARAIAREVHGHEPGIGPDRFATESSHPFAAFSKAHSGFPFGAFAGVDGVGEVDVLRSPTPPRRPITLVYDPKATPPPYLAALTAILGTETGRAVTPLSMADIHAAHPQDPATALWNIAVPESLVVFADGAAAAGGVSQTNVRFPSMYAPGRELYDIFTRALLRIAPALAEHVDFATQVVCPSGADVLLHAIVQRTRPHRIAALVERRDWIDELQPRLVAAAAIIGLPPDAVQVFSPQPDRLPPTTQLEGTPGIAVFSDHLDGQLPIPRSWQTIHLVNLWTRATMLALLDWDDATLRAELAALVRAVLGPDADRRYADAAALESAKVEARRTVNAPILLTLTAQQTHAERTTVGLQLLAALQAPIAVLGQRDPRTIEISLPPELAAKPRAAARVIWDVLEPSLQVILSRTFPSGEVAFRSIEYAVDRRITPIGAIGGAALGLTVGLFTAGLTGLAIVLAGAGALIGGGAVVLARQSLVYWLYHHPFANARDRYEAAVRDQPLPLFPQILDVRINETPIGFRLTVAKSRPDAYSPALAPTKHPISRRLRARLCAAGRNEDVNHWYTEAPPRSTA